VLVELRETSNGSAVSQRAVFLQNDGQVLDTDGSVGYSATTVKASGYDLSYFVVVKHRNHLPIMSAAAVSLPNAAAYDFSTSQAQAFGTNPMYDLGGVFGLISGDANLTGIVTASDISDAIAVLNQTGYLASDANLTGITTASDISEMITNLNKASQLP
jgi:hypothetical protein